MDSIRRNKSSRLRTEKESVNIQEDTENHEKERTQGTGGRYLRRSTMKGLEHTTPFQGGGDLGLAGWVETHPSVFRQIDARKIVIRSGVKKRER